LGSPWECRYGFKCPTSCDVIRKIQGQVGTYDRSASLLGVKGDLYGEFLVLVYGLFKPTFASRAEISLYLLFSRRVSDADSGDWTTSLAGIQPQFRWVEGEGRASSLGRFTGGEATLGDPPIRLPDETLPN